MTFSPSFKFFAGVDSDGCVFPTMELKHKECFIPEFIRFFNLQSVSSIARETWEFVNLYSIDRGINRFPALLKTLELLSKRPVFIESGIKLPILDDIRDFVCSGKPLSNAGLKEFMKEKRSNVLENLLMWSEAVNESVDRMVKNIYPFKSAVKVLEKLSQFCDIMVVSGTPTAALEKEWTEHNLKRFVKLICGQEAGSKKDHLINHAKGRYAEKNILMIGDAPQDHKAAQSINAFFFPINPGKEEESWKKILNEGIDRFTNNSLDDLFQQSLLEDFYSYLPEKPSFETVNS